jgi:diguanylate cyclase (GGDEF)-like protein
MDVIGSVDDETDFFRHLLGQSDLPAVITDATTPGRPVVFANAAFEAQAGKTLHDAAPFWKHAHAYPIRNAHNVVTHYVCVQRQMRETHGIAQSRPRRGREPHIATLHAPTDLDVDAASREATEKVDEELAAFVMGEETARTRSTVPTAQLAISKLNAVLNSITEGCFSLDREWRMSYINDQAARWLRRRREDLIGKNLWDEFPDAVGGNFYRTYQQAMSTRTYAQCDQYYPPVGQWFNARAYPSEEGLTVFFLDVSERKCAEDRMLYAASHDQLTALMNRDTCLQKLEETLSATQARRGAIAVLFIDLDRFKEINDGLGHRAGDHVLRLLGLRMAALNTEWRYCARNSGDEFLFVLDPADVAQAEAFAKRLLEQICEPFDLAGRRVTIGASIGIAVAEPGEVISASDLVNHADTAMYAAKASGRLAVRVFSPDTVAITRQRHQLRTEMAAAIDAGQFVLYYQPQIRLSNGRMEGVEALVRWNHPVYGMLSPTAFLDIAEQSPLILKLGAWVADEACRQQARWTAMGHCLQVAINVSARQLVDPHFSALILDCVRRHGVSPHFIELEITESMLAQDLQATSEVLTQLAAEGFQVALDDFGTGFSNLAYINRFPVTAIKIDRSFLTDIEKDPRAIELVKGIVAMAKSLKLGVVCEGIETQGQRRALETTRCDIIQGYLISRPLPADDLLERFLADQGFMTR